MVKAFYNPGEAILDAKKLGDWASTILVLAISAVLMAILPTILLKTFLWKPTVYVLIAAVVGPFVAGLFLKVAVSILGAKNPGFYETTTTVVYSSAPFVLTMLVGALFNMIPYVGVYLFTLFAVLGGIAMTATYIRGVKELTHADLLTGFLALAVVGMAGASMGYMVYMLSFIMSFISVLISAGM